MLARCSWLLLAALLPACSADGDTAALLPIHQAAVQQTLQLALTGASTGGETFGWVVTGAQPGEEIRLMVGNGGLGDGVCPPALGGLCAGFFGGSLGYLVVARGVADATGSWSQDMVFPGGVTPGWFQLQAFVFDGANSNASDAVQSWVGPACTQDAFEPNDQLADAADAGLGPVDATVCPSDDDFYVFTVPANGFVEVTFDIDTSSGDLDVWMTDATGNPIDTSALSGATERLAWFNYGGAPVDVFVRVYPFIDPGYDGVSYSMRSEAVVAGQCFDDANEEDDTSADARAVGTGTWSSHSCDGDDDWFSVDLLAGQVLRASLDWLDTSADLGLTVFDGGLAAQNTPVDFLEYAAPVDEAAFIEVALLSDNALQSGIDYDLVLDVITPGVCDEDVYEPDDTAAQARPIRAGRFDGRSCDANSDWFSVDLVAGEQLSYFIDEDYTVGNVNSRFYDGGLNPQFTGLQDAWDYLAMADETVFIEVVLQDDDYDDGNDYVLDVDIEILALCPADSFEPNDTSSQATPLQAGLFTGLGSCEVSDADWYIVHVPAGNALTADIVFSHADADIDLRLRTVAGTVLDTSESTGDSEQVTVTSTVDTDYLVEVYLYADRGGPTVGGAPYDLSIYVVP